MADQITSPTPASDLVELPTNIAYKNSLVELSRYQDCYDGDLEKMREEPYLIPHEQEKKTGGHVRLQLRKSRTFYQNFVAPIVDTWQDLFNRGEPVIDQDTLKELFNGQEANVDGVGNDFVSFITGDLLATRFVLGQPSCLIDAPESVALSAEDEKKLGIRPILKVVSRLGIVDWNIEAADLSRSGQYNFLSMAYKAENTRRTFKDVSKYTYYRRIFEYRPGVTPNIAPTVASMIFQNDKGNVDKDWKLISDKTIPGFTDIPVVTLHNTDTWIHDVCSQVIKYLNLESILDNILYYQGYRQTFLIGDIEPAKAKKVNEFIWPILPAGSSVHTVTAENPMGLISQLEATETKIWRLGFNQIRQMAANSKAVAGADTLREEKENTLNMVKSNMRQWENNANRILGVANQYRRESARVELDPAKLLRFSRDLTASDLDQTLTIFNALRTEMSKLPELRKEVLKMIVAKLSIGVDKLPKINEEIDALQDEDLTDQKIGKTLSDVMKGGELGADDAEQ